jgi:hypothetical protein
VFDGWGAVYIANSHEATIKVDLQLRARTLGPPAHVAISLNGYRLGSVQLTGTSTAEQRYLDVSLLRGDNLLQLACLDPPGGVPVAVEQLSVRRLEGFYPPETTAMGISRWMADRAAYIVGNESGGPWVGDLRVVAKSFAVPRRLAILKGETVLRTVAVPPDGQLPIVLPSVRVDPGENTFRLHSVDGADPVYVHTDVNDRRPVSFRLFDVALEPRVQQP